ncbi:hypothetical protein BV372_18435 [Nostoc sp. T09]|uniref:DUF262 domain-containing protein n=1 Tax=Nostoc sp. T09 TaxID=1932621 RepID=UPI000A360DD9|nr:DUF262 domain-containing protein [Nostoc sp. T09]OUL32824.1 hypothetical protein BV372_18435 [Nostoc sp. T09]
MANWEAYRISDIITDIDEKRFVLPVIQRRLVWDEDKMELLFDTLLKGDSFGGIMVIKEDKDSKPLFSFRPFTKDGESINSIEIDKIAHSQSFVIDGQQRLQSFYIGLTGTIKGKILYFDLFSNYNSEFEFKFESEFSKLPKQAKDDSNKTIKAYKWYSVNDLFKKLKLAGKFKSVVRSIIASDGITNDNEKDHISENIIAFHQSIFAVECLGISEVIIDKTFNENANRQRIVELFRRLNDGGTKLSAFDLVASVLKGFEWKMESFLDEMLSQYNEIGLTQDNLIKLIFLLQDNHKKEMTEIETSDAKFAIDNKERIKNTLSCIRQFLIHSHLYNYYKDSNRSFIPLFFIAYHIFHKNITDKQVEEFFDNYDTGNPDFSTIKKWIYYSLVNGVFRSKGAGWIPYKTGIRKLLDEIKLHKNSKFPISKLFHVYKEHGVNFTETFDTLNIDRLESSFMFYLMYDRKQTINIQDVDHIMPKSILQHKKYDWEKINSIKNYQLLDPKTNRGEKNAKSFKEWISNDKYVVDKTAFITKHLIPPDESIWTEDKFEDFVTSRAELILQKVTAYVR